MPDLANEAETGLSSVIDADEAQLPQDLPVFDHTESLFQMENQNPPLPAPQLQVHENDSNEESEDENL